MAEIRAEGGCPLINTVEWQKLTDLFGDKGAFQFFVANNYDIPSLQQIHSIFGEEIKNEEAKTLSSPIQQSIDSLGITGTGERVLITYNTQEKKQTSEIDNNDPSYTTIRVNEDKLFFPKEGTQRIYGNIYTHLLGKDDSTLKKLLLTFRHSKLRQEVLEKNPNLKGKEEVLQAETLALALQYDSVNELFDDAKMVEKAKYLLNKYHSEVGKELNTTRDKAREFGKKLSLEDQKRLDAAPEPTPLFKETEGEKSAFQQERGQEIMKENMQAIRNSLLKRASRLDAARRSKHDDSAYINNLADFVKTYGKFTDASTLMHTLDFMEKEHKFIKEALGDFNRLNGNFLSISFNVINGYKTFKEMTVPKAIKGMTEEEAKTIRRLVEEVKKKAAEINNLEEDIQDAARHYFVKNHIKHSTDPEVIEFLKNKVFKGEYDQAQLTNALQDEAVVKEIYNQFFAKVKDATWNQRWFDFIGSSHNKLPSLFLKQYQIQETKAKLKANDLKADFLQVYRDLNGQVDFMFETDSKGKKTGKFIPRMVEQDLEGGGVIQVESAKYKALNPKQKAFADFVYDTMGELFSDFEGAEYSNRVPAVPVDEREWKEMVADVFRLRDVRDKEERNIDEQGHIISFVPSKFIKNLNQMMLLKIPEGADEETVKDIEEKNRAIDEENQRLHAEAINYNLEKTIPAFIDAMTTFNFKKKMEDEVLLTRELIARQDILAETQSSSVKIVDKQMKKLTGKELDILKATKSSYMQDQYEDWMQRVFYEDYNKDEGNWTKTANILLQYTSMNTLGFNWKAGVGNKLYGEIQNIIEGYGGKHYNSKNYKKYWGRLNKNTASWLYKLHKNEIGDNADLAIIKYFDVLQDTRELLTGGPIESKLDKVSKATNLAYMFNELGEFSMQNSVLFAMMDNYEMLDADGKTTTLKEAYESKNGKLTLKKGFKKADGSEFTTDDFAEFRNKVLAVIQDLHGTYTREHSAALQKYAMGRIVMQFKKWLPNAIRRRFGSRFGEAFYNERLESLDEGMYITTWKFARELMKGYKDIVSNYKLMWAELSPDQQANVRRTMGELGALIGITLLGYGLKGLLDDEEEKKWAAAFYFQDRLMSELRTFTPFGIVDEFRKIQKSPFSAFSTYDKLVDFGSSLFMLPYDLYDTQGTSRQEVWEKFGKKGVKLVPVAGQVHSTMHMADNMQYYRLF